MSTPDPYGQQQYQPQQPMQPPMQPAGPYQPYAAGPELNGKAVAAMVCGVLFCAGPLGIIALVLGKSSQREIEAGMGIGRPLAKAGRVLGWIGVAFTIFWVGYFILIIAVIGTAASSVSTY